MTFLLIVKIILLIAALLTAFAAIGANSNALGNRCVVLTAVFVAALVGLIVFEMTRGIGV